MKTNLLALLALTLLMAACSGSSASKNELPSVDEVKGMEGIKNSELVNNPVSADVPLDPDQAAQIKFEEESFDFGNLKAGDKVEHVFKFKNVGKAPLSITNAVGDCGCTVPEYPKEPIAPGGTGEIKVSFNSTGKKGKQQKTVTITGNTIPNTTKISILSNVSE